MNTPVIKEPTKKKFHFPKSAEQSAPEAEKPPVKARKAATPKKATAKKAPAKTAEASKTKKADAAPAPAPAEEKTRRAKKEKVVRDSFTMPKSDYAKIAVLKQKCLDAGISVKKSEVLRAGLLLLEGATAQRLLAAISAVETVKTGRPSKA